MSILSLILHSDAGEILAASSCSRRIVSVSGNLGLLFVHLAEFYRHQRQNNIKED